MNLLDNQIYRSAFEATLDWQLVYKYLKKERENLNITISDDQIEFVNNIIEMYEFTDLKLCYMKDEIVYLMMKRISNVQATSVSSEKKCQLEWQESVQLIVEGLTSYINADLQLTDQEINDFVEFKNSLNTPPSQNNSLIILYKEVADQISAFHTLKVHEKSMKKSVNRNINSCIIEKLWNYINPNSNTTNNPLKRRFKRSDIKRKPWKSKLIYTHLNNRKW